MYERERNRDLREVAEFWEDIHMAETIDGNDGTVSRSFLDVEQRMPELFTIGMKEIYRA